MEHSRRTVLFATGGALAWSSCGRGFDLHLAPDATYDEVLDAVHQTDMELSDALSNHVPMAVEALVAAGFPDEASPFAARYAQSRNVVRAQSQPALTPSERTAALGVYDKREEWTAAFEEDLKTQTPAQTFKNQWPVLVSNFAAIHGTLRTAHAARALQQVDTPARRRELARGLAYWAARSGTLPGKPGSAPQAGLGVTAAMARIPLIPASQRVNSGNIRQRLAPLEGNAEFASAVAALDVSAIPVNDAIAELAVLACRIFVKEGKKNIALLHGITGTLALRSFAPWLDVAELKTGLAYAFQNVAAFYSIQGTANGLEAIGAATTSTQALLEKAAHSTSYDPEHDIKLTEAVVREHQLSDRAELLRAAEALLG